MASTDPCSLSNHNEVTVSHWHLSISPPNFETKILTGKIRINAKVISDNATQLILDTRDLTIVNVIDGLTGLSLSFKLGSVYEKCPAFGSPLIIDLPPDQTSRGSTPLIVIDYTTSPQSSAVQWLEPAQTAGKRYSYLFTQCQAIHCRSLLPVQDTPSVKSTYSADVTVPKGLTALMSAVRDEEGTTIGEFITYKFEQKVPIPSYLTALVIGALESRRIGPRSHVWSEKENVDKAAFEFSQTEDMLKAAESIAGPYLWGVYDLLVLPPSFPYGGMENPCLTFVTPTLLAGDKSLANVVAHEISHSWTGNLVTNKNWEHFWLNEGFTRYLESLIVAAVWGEKERHLQQMLGWKSLQDSVDKFGPTNPLTSLVPTLSDIDPDDAFSSVPYEKGFALLYLLETIVGLNKMKGYLRSHVENFKYKTIDSNEWKEFFLQHFEKENDDGLFANIDWDKWFYSPGMPPYQPQYDVSASSACSSLAERWSQCNEDTEFTVDEFEALSSTQGQEFLNQLLNKPPLSVNVLKKLETVYKMKERANSEIRFRWLRLALKGKYVDVYPHVVQFLLEQGRMKFVRPLYRELYNCDGDGKKLAMDTFIANKGIYHGIASTMIAKDLGIN